MVSKAAQAAAAQRTVSTSDKQADAWKKHSAQLEKIAAIATHKINDLENNSLLFKKEQLDVIPKFLVEELTMGRVLGKGGFGTVNEIREIKCKKAKADAGPVDEERSFLKDEEDDGTRKDQEHQDKKFIADHCIREGGDARYCIKVRGISIFHAPTYDVDVPSCSISHSLTHSLHYNCINIDFYRPSAPMSSRTKSFSPKVSSTCPSKPCSSRLYPILTLLPCAPLVPMVCSSPITSSSLIGCMIRSRRGKFWSMMHQRGRIDR